MLTDPTSIVPLMFSLEPAKMFLALSRMSRPYMYANYKKPFPVFSSCDIEDDLADRQTVRAGSDADM